MSGPCPEHHVLYRCPCHVKTWILNYSQVQHTKIVPKRFSAQAAQPPSLGVQPMQVFGWTAVSEVSSEEGSWKRF